MTNVIAFSLFGSDAKYTVGALKNADLCKVFFEGWRMRVYYDLSVPKEILFGLELGGVELIRLLADWGECSRLWRFFPAQDHSIEHFISRDCDSRLSERDAVAVSEWIKSGKDFHVIRDHPGHVWPMMAGAWGCKGGAVADMSRKVAGYLATAEEGGLNRTIDQCFLRDVVYPVAKDSLLSHSDDCSFESDAVPIPRARLLDDYAFIGEPFGDDDIPIGGFRGVWLKKEC